MLRITTTPRKETQIIIIEGIEKPVTSDTALHLRGKPWQCQREAESPCEKGSDINSPETSSGKPTDGKKAAFLGLHPGIDNLFEEIKEFLETKRIEVYRMQANQEAYQVKHKGQVIRIYVQRK